MGIKIYNMLDPFIQFNVTTSEALYIFNQGSTGTTPSTFSYTLPKTVVGVTAVRNNTSYPIITSNGQTIAPGTTKTVNTGAAAVTCRIEGSSNGYVRAQVV